MMIQFDSEDLPVAHSMVKAARDKSSNEIHEKYIYFWIAFNNIYTTLTFVDGGFPTKHRRDTLGNIRRISADGIQIPDVYSAQESQEMNIAFGQFDDELKHSLIIHPSIYFFVNRSPKWFNQEISTDILGQEVNGVLKLNKMVDKNNPVWSPLDKTKYRDYVPENTTDRNILAYQILKLLYAIRCNLMHGGKRYDDANDIEVLKKGFPLLELIVDSFLC